MTASVHAFRVGSLKAVNADELYTAEDAITGDEERRERTLRADVCPQGHVLSIACRAGALRELNKRMVPHLVRLLNSVEFAEALGGAASGGH